MSAPAGPAGKRRRRARTALSAAMAGIALFLSLNIVLQLSPPHYSMVSQAVSDLAVGPYGWAMDIAFFVSGVSILAFAAGAFLATSPKTRPLPGFLLLTVWGLATVAIAFVPPDVVDTNGYPGTLKAFAASSSVHGKLHLAIAAVVFLSMVLGLAVSSVHLGREPGLRPAQRTARLIAAAAFAGLLLTDPLGTRGIYGIMERGVSLLGFTWVVMVARRLRRDQRTTGNTPGLPSQTLTTVPILLAPGSVGGGGGELAEPGGDRVDGGGVQLAGGGVPPGAVRGQLHWPRCGRLPRWNP